MTLKPKTMKFRIKRHKHGYVVEVQKVKWYGRRYWTHFVSVRGCAEIPWYHETYEYAEANLVIEVKRLTRINSDKI